MGKYLCTKNVSEMLTLPCDIPLNMTNAGTKVPAFVTTELVIYFATISTLSVASTPSKSVAVAVEVPTSFKCSAM